MAEVKHMQMVSLPVYGADGLSVEYGPGELHEPGTLPEGVPYTDVLVGAAQLAGAPAHAQPAKAAPKAETRVHAGVAAASASSKSR